MSDDVVDLVYCAICKRPLKVVHPDAVEFNGKPVHKECAEEAMQPPKPNNSSYT